MALEIQRVAVLVNFSDRLFHTFTSFGFLSRHTHTIAAPIPPNRANTHAQTVCRVNHVSAQAGEPVHVQSRTLPGLWA